MDQFNSTTLTPDRQRGQHLKFEDRCSIKIFNKLGYSLRKTAKALDCSPSTVMYELQRGTGERKGDRGRKPEYSAKRGQLNYEMNRQKCHKPHKLVENNPFIAWTTHQVKQHNWSLDACVGYARRHSLFGNEDIVCTKTLYNELWAGNLPIDHLMFPRRCNAKPNMPMLVRTNVVLVIALMNVQKSLLYALSVVTGRSTLLSAIRLAGNLWPSQ